jgi:hypothetical protein
MTKGRRSARPRTSTCATYASSWHGAMRVPGPRSRSRTEHRHGLAGRSSSSALLQPEVLGNVQRTSSSPLGWRSQAASPENFAQKILPSR